MVSKKYCIECGKKLGFFRTSCSDCYSPLCLDHRIELRKTRYSDSRSYCIICAIKMLKERENQLLENMVCSECGNKISDKVAVYCPFCGTHLKKDKIQKLKEKNGKNS